MASQLRLDGVAAASRQVKFSGSVDLDLKDYDRVGWDGLIVTVVIARVTNTAFPRHRKTGDMTRVDTASVEEFRVLGGDDDELREILLERLQMGGETLFQFPEPARARALEGSVGSSPPSSDAETAVSESGPPSGVDEETGEITDGDEEEEDIFVPPAPQPNGRAVPPPDAPAGPQPDYGDVGTQPGVVETVGSVYDGRKRDPVLEQFTSGPAR